MSLVRSSGRGADEGRSRTDTSSRPIAERIACRMPSVPVTGASSVSQTSSNRPSAARAVSTARRVLPAPPGPRIVTRRWSTQRRLQVVDRAFSPHERRQGRRQGRVVAAHAVLAAKDREVQVLQLRRGVGAQLVGKLLAQSLVRRQGLVGPAMRRQRRQVEDPEAVPIGMGRREVGQLGDDGEILARTDPVSQTRLDGGEPQLAEPVYRRGSERELGDVGQRVAAPACQCLVDATRRHKALELHGVDRCALQDVTRRGSTRARRPAAAAGCGTRSTAGRWSHPPARRGPRGRRSGSSQRPGARRRGPDEPRGRGCAARRDRSPDRRRAPATDRGRQPAHPSFCRTVSYARVSRQPRVLQVSWVEPRSTAAMTRAVACSSPPTHRAAAVAS